MSKVERIEHDVQNLSPDELADFRKWFTSYDSAKWDVRLERDIQAGKLDSLRNEALAEHAAHGTKEL